MICNMSWCEVIMNLLIGLISGAVSSLIVSILLKKHWDREQLAKDFEDEKQEFSRYLSYLRQELVIGSKTGDYSFVLRELEDEPIRSTFRYLDENDRHSIQTISNYLEELRTYFEKGNTITDDQLKIINSKLYKYRVDVLKYKMEGREV